MNIYKPAPVSKVPQEYLEQWKVYELPNGDRHLVGRPQSTGDGRVSSKIVKTDGSDLTTDSGRRYQLVGTSGTTNDAEYMWMVWCKANKVDPATAKDVSSEYKGVP